MREKAALGLSYILTWGGLVLAAVSFVALVRTANTEVAGPWLLIGLLCFVSGGVALACLDKLNLVPPEERERRRTLLESNKRD